MRFSSLVLASILLLCHSRGLGAQDALGVPDIRQHLLTSQNVEEEYLILVSLPDGYSASRRELASPSVLVGRINTWLFVRMG